VALKAAKQKHSLVLNLDADAKLYHNIVSCAMNMQRFTYQTIFVNSVSNKEIYNIYFVHFDSSVQRPSVHTMGHHMSRAYILLTN